MKQYLHNLWLWAHVWWLWTRRSPYPDENKDHTWQAGMVYYKPGWSPLKFLPIYMTSYLAGTLCGYGVVSLSRAWYDRSVWYCIVCGKHEGSLHSGHDVVWSPVHPFARFMTRALNWLFPGSRHGRETGPRLFGSVNLRD